jgi:uncharacterized protein
MTDRPSGFAVKHLTNGFVGNRVLKLNIGFLLAAGPGHSHETTLNIPAVRVSEDVDLNYVRGTLRLSRTREGILVQGVLSLGVSDECYRCLAPVEREMQIAIEELYSTPGTHRATEFMIGEDAILDLAPLLRDEALIADAQGVLCKPDCKGLCSSCGANLNEGPCECEAEIDPRFAKLKELLSRQT